jgi:sugar lactone lactonase YvrE
MRSALLTFFILLATSLPFAPQAFAHVGTGIAVDARGQVFFVDTTGNRLWKISADGKLALVTPEIHSNLLVLNPDGSLYVDNERHSPRWPAGLLRIDPAGRVTAVTDAAEAARVRASVPSVDPAKFPHASTTLRAPDGTIFVRDCNTIRKLTPAGAVVELPGGAEAGWLGKGEANCRRVLGFALDTAGNLYVANYGKAKVYELSPVGGARVVFRSTWPWVPTGVTAAGDNLYILERYGHPYGAAAAISGLPVYKFRVRKLGPDGKISSLATVH